mgnify:CR=1 FL=1
MFDRDDSDDEGPAVSNDVTRVNAQLAKRNALLEKSMATAASEEPDIYDYDGAYDSFKRQETSKHQLSQATAASREAPVSPQRSTISHCHSTLFHFVCNHTESAICEQPFVNC